jgi:hypothetical protein
MMKNSSCEQQGAPLSSARRSYDDAPKFEQPLSRHRDSEGRPQSGRQHDNTMQRLHDMDYQVERNRKYAAKGFKEITPTSVSRFMQI